MDHANTLSIKKQGNIEKCSLKPKNIAKYDKAKRTAFTTH